MDIGVGDSIIVEVSTFEDRFLGLVADIAADGRLKVYVSVPKAVIDRLAIDTSVLVRYAYDGKLMGFNSRVLGWKNSSDVLIELAAPKQVFDAEDRQEPRCSCFFPAFVADGETLIRAVVEDMSVSCCRVRFLEQEPTGLSQEPGSRVRLTFHPFDMDGVGYAIGCSVLKCFMKDGQRYVVLRYANDEPDTRKRISGFIEAQVCCIIPGYRL
ncbi:MULTISPECIES: PilZ domain-containing protein [unclassified Pseudodesulfovibrio]|uniref:PilZ domain-containing protein n=1 Tax=unclassified Pseudodesulfovibrio TaxID=2661612 RepID=UPI000FEB680E|nr:MULTISPECIES: PilZ domain-containing protein [unclassified Pseudodesulfovibrio]MCJ2164052.1 flagellar brake protein [Pseudodesulfovibrio sp. S3-i]RWU05314.1 PilZ domain-containing protein [Pseudodesulfovibrio sp. S3]